MGYPLLALIVISMSLVGSASIWYHTESATPWYARCSLFTFGSFNVMAVLPHWVLDDAGYESIANVRMGPMSIPYRLAISYCKSHAIEALTSAVVMYYVAVALPSMTFRMLILLLWK